jgi:hypothetical protein
MARSKVTFAVLVAIACIIGPVVAAGLLLASALVLIPLGIKDPYNPFLWLIYGGSQFGAVALCTWLFFRSEPRIPAYAWWIAVLVSVPFVASTIFVCIAPMGW